MPQGSGKLYEQQAKHFLERKGLKCLAENFSCRGGEIDLVMQHGRTLVFVEVRFRRSASYGSAAETITKTKKQRISLAASHYLSRNNAWHASTRFDVIAMDGEGRAPDGYNIQWLTAAFEPQ